MNIPQTTLFSILKNGIGGTAYDTVVKICNELNIELVNHSSAVKMDDNTLALVQKYNFLDDVGIYTVNAVLDAEHARCTNGPRFTIGEE